MLAMAITMVVRFETAWTKSIVSRQAYGLTVLVRSGWMVRRMMVVGMLLHRVDALDTDALHLVGCRFRMILDFVHGRSEFEHGSAQDGCALSVW